MNRKKKSLVFLSTFGLAVGAAALPAYALNGTWINTATQPTDWGTAGNWSGNIIADGAGFTASFTANIAPAVGPYTVNLESSRTIGNIIFTDSTTSSHNLTISGANILTLDDTGGPPTIDVTQSGRGLTISSQISGSEGLEKNGVGTLFLNGTNNYTGGTIINAGELRIASDAALGNASGSITFNGGNLRANNTFPQVGNAGGVNIASTRNVIVNVAGGSIGVHGNNNFTTTGILSGAGTFTFSDVGGAGGRAVNFNSTGNTFTGRLEIGSNAQTVQVNSLSDAVGAGAIALNKSANGTQSTFTYGTGATGGLTLNNRVFEVNSASALTATISNLNTTHAITVNTNLTATGAGAKTLTLNAASGPINLFAGDISNGSGGGTIAITKIGAGVWRLGGNNTHTGATTVTTGTLGLANVNALQNSTLNTGTSGTQQVTFNVVGTNTYNLGGLTGADALAIGANTISVGANGANTSYNGNISGTGGLTKVGPGTLTLATTNGYTGVTSIQDGTLALGVATAIGSSSSVVIGSEGVLDTTAFSFTMLPGQPFTWDIDPTGAGAAGLLDASILNIANGAATFNALGTLDDPFYIIADYASLTGTFASSVVPTGYALDYNFNGGNQIALVQNATIPEPATAALGLMGLAGLMMRRHRMA